MKIIDRDIAEKIAEENQLTIAKLGLRYDKVAVRLLSNLRNSIHNNIPQKTTVLLAITAPIKLPLKTEFELCEQIRDILNADIRYKGGPSTIFQNKIFFRIVNVPIIQTVRFVGFVHNPEQDPNQLLDLATAWLAKN